MDEFNGLDGLQRLLNTLDEQKAVIAVLEEKVAVLEEEVTESRLMKETLFNYENAVLESVEEPVVEEVAEVEPEVV